METVKLKVIIVVGPTASGKTDLAIRLAQRFHGELIAADSRTVYRGMDIGTAKPIASEGKAVSLSTRSSRGAASAEEPPAIVEGVPHWLLDIRDPNQSYSVAEFKADAERLIREISARGKLPIVVGGTGLYVSALVNNFAMPDMPAQPKLRESFDRKSNRELFAFLRKLDPETARTIDRKNKRRLIRALEVCIFTGQPFSALRSRGEPPFDFLQLGVLRTRSALYRRINQRTRAMFRNGLLNEAEQLLKRYGPNIEPLRGIIYREVVEFLQQSSRVEGKVVSPSFHGRENRGTVEPTLRLTYQESRRSFHELMQRVMYANHRYARHQLMWFRRDKRIHWVRTSRQAERLVRTFITTPSGEGMTPPPFRES